MVKNVVFAKSFKRTVEKIKDSALKERVKKQIAELIERPEIGKPLRFQTKGERTVRVPPFRIIYAWKDDTVYLLDFDKRDRIYR
ncbi:MAG: type II toxin-antitoxin system RelE/ParE family toxin [Candidatus Micrarchaeota archaeon]